MGQVRSSKEQLVQLRELFRNYIDSGGNGGGYTGIGEPGAVGPPDTSLYGGYQIPGENPPEPVSPSSGPGLVSRRVGRQRGKLRVTVDGSVQRVTDDDQEQIEQRIRTNSQWDNQRLSGNNAADMAMQAAVGNNVDEPDAAGCTCSRAEESPVIARA